MNLPKGWMQAAAVGRAAGNTRACLQLPCMSGTTAPPQKHKAPLLDSNDDQVHDTLNNILPLPQLPRYVGNLPTWVMGQNHVRRRTNLTGSPLLSLKTKRHQKNKATALSRAHLAPDEDVRHGALARDFSKRVLDGASVVLLVKLNKLFTRFSWRDPGTKTKSERDFCL